MAIATAEDFWNAQTATSHKPIDKIMESLVAQPGVPILTFGDPASGNVPVDQKRFFLSPSIQPDPAQKWTLPVCFKAADDAQACQLLSPTESTLKVPAGPVFFPNAGGKGYYRIQYSPSAFNALLPHVETALTAPERLNLIGNEWAEMRANHAGVGDVLNLLGAMKSDSSAAVVGQTADDVAAVFDRIVSTEDERRTLAAWVRNTFGPQLARLGGPIHDDSPNTRELRARLFSLLGTYGKDSSVLAEARTISDAYIADPGSIDATLGQAALQVAAHNGNSALFDRLQKLYETSTNPEIQQGALRLLAGFEQPALAQRGLDYAVSDKVRNQDSAIQIAIALQNPATRDLSWSYIKSNWDKVQAEFTTASGSYVVDSTSSFCSADAREDVDKFFAEHKVPNSSIALKQADQRIDGCAELRKLQEPNLQQWLALQQNLGTQ